MNSQEYRNLSEAYLDVYQEEVLDELHRGRHGQTETEYMDSRSDAGKQISGDSKTSGAAYSHRSYKGVGKPAKPGERQETQGKMDKNTRTDILYRKAARLKKEELSLDERVLGQDPEMRRARTKDDKRLPPSSGKEYAANQKKSISYMNKLTKNNKIIPGMAHEEVEEFDEATAMSKRGLNEPEIRNKIAAKTSASGAGKFADKATKLADRETYGNKEMKAGREKLARAQRGTFRDTTSSSPGLRGYGYKSSDPAVKAKQDARGNQRARAALTPNERKQNNMESYDLFDYIMEYLITEGYADTNENALVIMANMSEKWKNSIIG